MVKISTLSIGDIFKFPNGRIIYKLEYTTGFFHLVYHYRDIRNRNYYTSDGNDFVEKRTW